MATKVDSQLSLPLFYKSLSPHLFLAFCLCGVTDSLHLYGGSLERRKRRNTDKRRPPASFSQMARFVLCMGFAELLGAQVFYGYGVILSVTKTDKFPENGGSPMVKARREAF